MTWSILAILYGVITFSLGVSLLVDLIDYGMSGSTYASIVVFWPLHIVKYVLKGLWKVFIEW